LFGVEKENFNINLDSYLGFLLPEDKAEIYAKINKALAGDEEYYVEHEIIKGDGSRAFIAETGGVERDSAGKAIAMFGATRDITEQMQILNVLKQKEHNLKETQRIAKIAKWEWNLVNGEILLSQEFLSLMNYSTQKQLISYEEFASHLTNEDAERVGNETFAAIGKKLNSFTLEFDFKCDNNIVKRILCHVNAEYNKDGNAVMLYGASQDITDRRAIELEMLSAKEKAEENDRLKTAFLANMSHEIRTPLNGILGFSEVLKDNSLTNEERKEYLTTIEKSGNRLLNIINDILDISKIETGQVSLLYKYSDVNDQLKFIYKFFKAEAEAKGIELKLGNPLDESESKIYTDKEKLYAILTNLVKNAIKFTLNGTILIDFEKDNKEYTFKVADTGIGVPKNRQEAIFDRFVQADLENKNAFQGAGLGLSISKAYVELLGGRIWLESEVDKGSTFYFTIPVIDENKSEVNAEKNTTDNMTLTRKIKILIAEDDLVTMKLFERIMSKYASSVLSATDGLTAVELMKANPDIDLIIMDIRMPIMDGYTATEEIRKFNNKVIIIGQSAHVFESNKDLSLKNGCNEYLSKPINIKELNEIIYKYFG
jgi:signal transduction histidine kinase/CheY-like chemotaxis protein